MMELFRTIRGVEVKVIADDFETDEDVGLSAYPQEIYAVKLNDDGTDGEPFELTDEESEKIGIEASEAYFNDGVRHRDGY